MLILDSTSCAHTHGLLNSMLATLNGTKEAINLKSILSNEYYIDPFQCHTGHKSLANIILPKTKDIGLTKEEIDKSRLELANLFKYYEEKTGKLSFYEILSFFLFDNKDPFENKELMSHKSLLTNNNAMNTILNQLNIISQHPLIQKKSKTGKEKKLLPESELSNTQFLYLSLSEKDIIGDKIIINHIKGLNKGIKQQKNDQWNKLTSAFIDEVGLFNKSPIDHSDFFLKRTL